MAIDLNNDAERGRVFLYLERLRDSGVVNMFGASAYLEDELGYGRNDAKDWLLAWMRSFRE